MNRPSYFVAGAMIKENGSKYEKFMLIKPSHSENPYVTCDRNSHALRLTGHTAALYYYNPIKSLLIKMDDPHYELNGKFQPNVVDITSELEAQIEKAIAEGDTLLTV